MARDFKFRPSVNGVGLVLVTENLIPIRFSMAGVIVTRTGQLRQYAPLAGTLIAVRASAGTSPTGAAILVDLNKNGTTVFTTQSKRPTIAISGNTALGDMTGDTVISISAGDYFTADIDQIGSTIAGSDLTIEAWMQP